jgi:two-component system cell cycle response regulator
VTVTQPIRVAVRVLSAVAALGLAAYAVQAIFAVCGSGSGAVFDACGTAADDIFEIYVYNALIAIAAALCLIRAATVARERGAWLALGLGLVAWAAGEAAYSILYGDALEPPMPSVSDALWLAFYPACYVAIVLLVRARVREFRASLWLDGLVGVLAMAAVGAAVVLGAVADGQLFALDLTYLLGDLLLLGFVVGALALTGWRPGRALALLGAGLAVGAVVDGFFLWLDASGSSFDSTVVATLWPASALTVAAAAWQRPAAGPVRVEGWRLLAVPTLFALAALGLLLYGLVAPVAPMARGLAIASLLAVIVRMSATLRENHVLLEGTRREALTDALTGLSNRRRLMLDLEQEATLASERAPRALMLFDLDGFKQYNDRFGHPVGDALLARLGRRLGAATDGRSMAYRLGGDEFCVLAAMPEDEARELVERAREALSDRGRGFQVGSSCGMVMIPAEAADVSAALRLADERLYAEKGVSKRAVASSQTAGALIQVLREVEPDAGGRLDEVATLAQQVGRRLGLSRAQLDELIRAAELHDVGKVAVPSSILRKAGPLDDSEWSFVRQHTLVGDRILSAAPALSSVAQVVRSSHERYDGGGYPDGLSGDEIPLAARVVAVCDAYHAMTSERPYRTALAHWEAIEELRRCAGRQFDPVVVAAFCELMSSVAQGRAA